MKPSSARLRRQGRISAAADGCATIEVSVPCSSCPQMGCSQRLTAGQLILANVDIPVGNRISITLDRADLTGACLRLFGPSLVWLLGLAWVSSSSAASQWGPVASTLVAVTGLAVSLQLGRSLVRRVGIAPEVHSQSDWEDRAVSSAIRAADG